MSQVIPLRSAAAPTVQPQANSAPVHIEVRGVGKTYLAGRKAVTALSGVDLTIQRGEIFGIIGRSGAGKSSLIRTFNRLEDVSEGQVLIEGEDIGTLQASGLVKLRRRIGMIFQHFNLLASQTVLENLALPLQAAGVSRAIIEQRARELLALVGLKGMEQVYPSRLSGGQKQRVGIARALMLEPSILLCDEATSALDPETTQQILALLKQINRKLGLTIVLITHEMAVVRQVCDRVAVLERGRVVEQGPVWQIFGQPQADATRALLAPLATQVPEDLEARLATGNGQRAVLELTFDGQTAAEPDLAAIAQHLGRDIELLHGAIERIQGHAQGRLLLAVRAAPAKLEQFLGLSGVFSAAKVVGHV
ncbi:ATP-binding cassette domain-containing protein [Pseudomonas sp. NPDC007930]|uniref:methionine ABC transporter ATP-binding protein n=1 Tax=Pseudomonas sp. NPDC007930 TaxID=3364417 RepID=UPI0036E0D828